MIDLSLLENARSALELALTIGINSGTLPECQKVLAVR